MKEKQIRQEELNSKMVSLTQEEIREKERDKSLETSLPFDKYKEEEQIEREKKLRLTSMYNEKQMRIKS
jgi:hypothetical protein